MIKDKKQRRKNNWVLNIFRNLKNTKKNFKKVKGSPYASMSFVLKAKKLIIAFLIPYLIYMFYRMITKVRVEGFMGTVQKLFMFGVMCAICWKIYKTIPDAQKQIDYYKKNPHVINYVSTNVKEDVNDILAKVKANSEKKEIQDKAEGREKNVQEKSKESRGKADSTKRDS